MVSFFAKYKNLFGNILLFLFVAIILLFTVRGLPGNPTPTQLDTTYWKDNGPFELSPERGRFSLLYSIIEDHSFHLQPSLAAFTAPDVGYLNHTYVSIFAPSISFLAIPGYVIGKYFGMSQFGSFFGMSLFALLNVLLIRAIAIRLGANPLAASIAGIAFLFGTPAFAYAVTFYEHHASTSLILLSLYLLIRYNNVISLILIWILYAFSFTVDYPNLFMLLPIAFATFLRSGVVETIHSKVKINVSFVRLLTVFAVIIPLAFLFWVNKMSYDNPLRISGSVPTIVGVSPKGTPIFLLNVGKIQKKVTTQASKPQPTALSYFEPFKPRNMLNGFYILLISPDRGVLMFAPIMLFGIAGIIYASKKKQNYISVLLGVIGFDFILYSMWGDPYGGWAFGGRYLIPAYSILSIYIAILLTRFGKSKLFLSFFFIIFVYSVMVNTLGAVTTNSNPPQIQAAALSETTHTQVLYTYMRNVKYLNGNLSKSYVFEAYANDYLTAWEYYSYVTGFILIVSSGIVFLFYLSTRKNSIKEVPHEV